MQNNTNKGLDSLESSLQESEFMSKVVKQLAESKKLLENAPPLER